MGARLFAKIYLFIMKILSAIAAGVLAAMMFLIMADVILRYVFKSPIMGAYEIVEYMMAVLVSFAVVYCAYQQGHVAVDFVFDKLPARLRTVVASVGLFIVLVLFALVAWQNILYIIETYHQRLTSSILYIPTYPFVAAVAVGFLGFCLVIFIDFIHALPGVDKK